MLSLVVLLIVGYVVKRPSITSPTFSIPTLSNPTVSTPTHTQTYYLRISVPPRGGKIEISDRSGSRIYEPDTQIKISYEHGAQITLTAIHNEGFEFEGWDGAISGSSEPTITFTMDSDKSINPRFKDIAPPKIISVTTMYTTEVCAVIAYETTEPATSLVEYGTTNTYGETTPPTDSNNIKLVGLNRDTTYHFRVVTKDASGLEAVSKDQVFQTLYPQPAYVGNRAPDFTMKNHLSGQDVSLSDFRGKKALLNLWATKCFGCVLELPYIQEIYDRYYGESAPPADLAVITVCLDRSTESISNFLAERPGQLTFPILVNDPSIITAGYTIRGMPTTFFINSDGFIKEIKEGAFESSEEIEAILKSLD